MEKPFEVGNRVRLLRLDGTLSPEVVVVHELWGKDDWARNASFLFAGMEQTIHTDLMRHEADDRPIVVPPGGEWYIARGSNMGWGRAKTIDGAVSIMRRQGGKVTGYVVHRVSKWTVVSEMGGLSYPSGIEPVEVRNVKAKKAA